MPLTELVRMFKGKVEEGASTSTDPSTRLHSDCVELVWENGQIMMQGKARKSSHSNNSQIIGPRPEDSRSANCSKVTKFSTMDTVMADFSMPAPCEMNVDQDVDLVPWLSYAMEEPLHNDYTYDFLNELSGVTINDLPADNQLGYCERKGRFQGDSGHDSSVSLKHGITSKVSSSNEKDNRGESSEVPQFLLPFQHSVPRSGISDTSGSNAGNAYHVGSRNSTINPSSLSAFTTLRLQKLDSGSRKPSTSSGLTNFPYFSWPATLSRASHGTVNPSNKLENDNKRCTLSGSNLANSTLVNLDSGCSQKEMFSHNQSIMASANGNSEALPTKPAEEPFSVKQQPSLGEDIATNHRSQNQACDTPMNKVSAGGDRNMEPVIATSSVCSANSAERGSDNPGRNLKRKSRETTESSGPSEEVEEESVGVKKPASARGGSKRSRAAEVHNLSERRRRDRINEKMRALQELIPNCNKADKASMLDEAIEYLKTLQLQVQMLSMGAGMYMHPMMLPPGMQPIHGVHMPPYAPMGLGMGMGMGFGINMLNMNNGVKMVPFQGPHYPVPGTGPTFPGMPGSTLQAFPHPGQGLPISMQQAPIVPPPMSANLLKTPTGLNASNVTTTSNAPHLAPLAEKNACNSQAIPSSVASNYLNQATNQSTNEGIQPSALCVDQPHGVNPSEKTTESSKGKDAMLT